MCDECQHWTTGEHCEFCKQGSYGDATEKQGKENTVALIFWFCVTSN